MITLPPMIGKLNEWKIERAEGARQSIKAL
jgi:hypothetical protein